MPLNSDQIELINSFLVKNEVVFDDVRHEVIDHIASDIEHNFEEIPFHQAIKIVLQKWQPQITLSESFWVTTWTSFPLLIVKKLKSFFQPFSLLCICLLVVLSFFLSYYPEVTESLNNNKLFKIVYFIWLTFSIGFGLKLFFSKGHTTYKYVFKRILSVIIMSSIIIFSISEHKDNLLISLLMINIISTPFLIKHYKAHFKFLEDHFQTI